MNGKRIIKKLTLYVSITTLIFILNSSSLRKKNKDYFRNSIKITKNKIEYNDGIIYIGDRKYLNSIKELNDNDVLVLDLRKASDPNLKIINSYQYLNPEVREEIIEGLLLYEEMYPSKWNRTKNSLIREWAAHNYMYFFGYEHSHTTDVDLNNVDEETYQIKKQLKIK